MSTGAAIDKSRQESFTSYGRVSHVHFACRAALPIGCSLRVTATHLWAPGTLSHISDPTDSKAVSVKTTEIALPDNTTDGDFDTGGGVPLTGVNQMGAYAYASSIEMVTSPETYPLWRTRTPVVVVMRHHHGSVQHHRYRYMVVCPGAEHYNINSTAISEPNTKGGLIPPIIHDEEYLHESKEAMELEGRDGMGVSTSAVEYFEGVTIGTEVMTWEDPFKGRDADTAFVSTASLPSVRRAAISRNLANLPYRTLDIDTETCQILTECRYSEKDRQILHGTTDRRNSNDVMEEQIDNIERVEYTHDGIRIDNWNSPNDYSFRPYFIREAINRENKSKKLCLMTNREIEPTAGNLHSVYSASGGGYSGYASSISGILTNTISCASVCDTDAAMSEGSTTPVLTGPTNTLSLVTTQVSFSDDLKQEFKQGIAQPDVSVIKSAQSSAIPSRKIKERIFFVCFHLPVILTHDSNASSSTPYRGWSACWAESLLAATEDSSVIRSHEAHWVGTVSVSAHDPINTEEDRVAVRSLLAEMNCTPLFIDKNVQDAHYLGMCKQVLWPAFHNIDLLDLSTSGWIHPRTSDLFSSGAVRKHNDSIGVISGEVFTESDWDQSRLDGWWSAYHLVNSLFADLMCTMLRAGDIMWVHDYHLCLLPKLLDDKERVKYSGRSVTKKVFFLHIPFPTSQIFRELECGEAILEGMLHADVVGFHAFDHTRHFLNAAKRILGLNYESLVGGLIGVQYGRKTVLVTMRNVSIEPKLIDAALTLSSVSESVTRLRQKHHSRIIVAGVDTAQRLSGINLKLLAFEKLLTDYPVWQQKVVMVQKCLIPGSRRADELNTVSEVRYLVRRIEDKFGHNVIDYEELVGSSVPIDQRLALWRTADVVMSTPIREGLSLLPMEFIYARRAPSTPGVIIWSEFSAVCSILNGALRVNPFDIQMTVTTMDKALTMGDQEREGRRFRDIGFVSSSPSAYWSSEVLRDLHDATAYANGVSDASESDDTTIVGTKFDKKDLITSTSAFLEYEYETAFTHLDFDAVTNAYNLTRRRVIILDLNGTIVIKEPPGKYLKREILGTSGHKPPQVVIRALTKLCADECNTVVVVSGDSQENVENAIGNIHGLSLAASNGACFSRPINGNEIQRQWKYFDLGVDWDAVKKIVLPILSKYTARTNGSFIKLTHSSIGWSYYSCDPEWGYLQASHLVLELEPVVRPFDVRFVMIKGIVEIVPRRLNKGLIVKKVLREVTKLHASSGVDFILCMGDDIHDEKMFTSVLSFIAEREDCDRMTPCPPVVDDRGAPVSDDGCVSYRATASNQVNASLADNSSLYCFNCAVGKKPSHASSYVDDAREVASLLVHLTGGDVRDWSLRSKSFEVNDNRATIFG